MPARRHRDGAPLEPGEPVGAEPMLALNGLRDFEALRAKLLRERLFERATDFRPSAVRMALIRMAVFAHDEGRVLTVADACREMVAHGHCSGRTADSEVRLLEQECVLARLMADVPDVRGRTRKVSALRPTRHLKAYLARSMPELNDWVLDYADAIRSLRAGTPPDAGHEH